MTEKKEVETITVATRVTKPTFKRIQTILEINAHINIADYIRDLIRRDLEARGAKTEETQK